MSADYALRLQYALPIIRLVNGISDSQQRGRVAASVAILASAAGLPRTLVDIRHEATHHELPSLPLLRLGATQALEWLRGSYWEGQAAQLSSNHQRVTSILRDLYTSCTAAATKGIAAPADEAADEDDEALEAEDSEWGAAADGWQTAGSKPAAYTAEQGQRQRRDLVAQLKQLVPPAWGHALVGPLLDQTVADPAPLAAPGAFANGGLSVQPAGPSTPLAATSHQQLTGGKAGKGGAAKGSAMRAVLSTPVAAAGNGGGIAQPSAAARIQERAWQAMLQLLLKTYPSLRTQLLAGAAQRLSSLAAPGRTGAGISKCSQPRLSDAFWPAAVNAAASTDSEETAAGGSSTGAADTAAGRAAVLGAWMYKLLPALAAADVADAGAAAAGSKKGKKQQRQQQQSQAGGSSAADAAADAASQASGPLRRPLPLDLIMQLQGCVLTGVVGFQSSGQASSTAGAAYAALLHVSSRLAALLRIAVGSARDATEAAEAKQLLQLSALALPAAATAGPGGKAAVATAGTPSIARASQTVPGQQARSQAEQTAPLDGPASAAAGGSGGDGELAAAAARQAQLLVSLAAAGALRSAKRARQEAAAGGAPDQPQAAAAAAAGVDMAREVEPEQGGEAAAPPTKRWRRVSNWRACAIGCLPDASCPNGTLPMLAAAHADRSESDASAAAAGDADAASGKKAADGATSSGAGANDGVASEAAACSEDEEDYFAHFQEPAEHDLDAADACMEGGSTADAVQLGSCALDAAAALHVSSLVTFL